MRRSPAEFTLEMVPRARLDLIDVRQQMREAFGDVLAPYPRALYCSLHTTAGFLDESVCARFNHNPDALRAYLQVFHQIFPPGATYEHDRLDRRSELTDEQRRNEPRNADSHLTFIGSGLESCVVYNNAPKTPVYLIELDGTNGALRRTRHSRVVGFHQEVTVDELELAIPVSDRRIDSVNLRDPRLGFFDRLQEMIASRGIETGWIDLSLASDERNAGLTVNEYETLLMRHDLPEVLQNPIRFMAEKGRNMLRDPRAIPGKALDYAKYDLVHVVHEFVERLGLSESIVDRLIDRLIAVPASHFLRMKRGVRLLVSDPNGTGCGELTHGTYQSPILVQWNRTPSQARRLRVSLVHCV